MNAVVVRVLSLAMLGVPGLCVPGVLPTSAHAQPAAAVRPADAGAASSFVDGLADSAFGLLRNGSLDRSQVRNRFRELLRERFAIDAIGARVIRRWRAQITPAQYAAYMATFPDYLVDIYADRLMVHANSDLKPIRASARGKRGDIDVYTQISTQPGSRPVNAVWTVRPSSGGYQVTNLTVSGVNLVMTQEADFSAYIQRNGFDAFLEFMRRRVRA